MSAPLPKATVIQQIRHPEGGQEAFVGKHGAMKPGGRVSGRDNISGQCQSEAVLCKREAVLCKRQATEAVPLLRDVETAHRAASLARKLADSDQYLETHSPIVAT
jgi:hypothetical protein